MINGLTWAEFLIAERGLKEEWAKVDDKLARELAKTDKKLAEELVKANKRTGRLQSELHS